MREHIFLPFKEIFANACTILFWSVCYQYGIWSFFFQVKYNDKAFYKNKFFFSCLLHMIKWTSVFHEFNLKMHHEANTSHLSRFAEWRKANERAIKDFTCIIGFLMVFMCLELLIETNVRGWASSSSQSQEKKASNLLFIGNDCVFSFLCDLCLLEIKKKTLSKRVRSFVAKRKKSNKRI